MLYMFLLGVGIITPLGGVLGRHGIGTAIIGIITITVIIIMVIITGQIITVLLMLIITMVHADLFLQRFSKTERQRFINGRIPQKAERVMER